MKYFEKLPKRYYYMYDYENKLNKFLCTNLYKKIKITFLNDNYVKYVKLDIPMRIEVLSYKLYGSVEYWWILALLNDWKDFIYDMPMLDEVIQEYVHDQNITLEEKITMFEEITVLEEDKFTIKIIDPAYLNVFLMDVIKSLGEK